MTFAPQPSYSYSDLGLKPIYKSDVVSRSVVDTSTDFFLGQRLSLPLVSAPMQTVTGTVMAQKLAEIGVAPFLFRTRDAEHDYAMFAELPLFSIPSIPATGDFLGRAQRLYDAGCRVFCIDVANGYSSVVERAVKAIRNELGPVSIVAGNVASVQGYDFLAKLGVDAVRVGIGGGSVCSTSISTRVGVGQASAVREIADFRANFKVNRWAPDSWPLIIADGGIRCPGDVALAIALGADVAMIGGMFSGCDESPGDIIDVFGVKRKLHAGQASERVKGTSSYAEGGAVHVDCKGPVVGVVQSIADGLRSAMSYMDCATIEEFRYLDDECFVYLHPGAQLERGIHAK